MTGNQENPCLMIKKEFSCTIYCLNRPVFNIYNIENGQNVFLGSIVDNFTCYHQTYTIKDEFGRVAYSMFGDCCQKGFWFRGIPADECQNVSFDLINANGQVIQQIKKKGAGALANWLTDAENYFIEFQPYMDWKQRALLTASLLMMDFMLFSRKFEN